MSNFSIPIIQNYIGGEFVPAKCGEVLKVMNPATGTLLTTAPKSEQLDVQLAVEAAEQAFPAWSQMRIDDRYHVLMKIVAGIESRFEELAMAETLDNGKPLWLSKMVDIPRAASNFRFFANAITQFFSESHDDTGNALNFTLRKPLGVVGCISPWNLPLYLFTWKIAPALAAGNTVVAKPSEVTPLTAYLLSEICAEAGLPAGVLNIVHGYGHQVGDAMSRHPKIKAISFTGSTAVGAQIASIAAPMFKKISLEMGGKNPTIIFEDCDYEATLSGVIRAAFSNQGQICLCGSRILIQDGIYDRLKADLVQKASALKVGDPLDPQTRVGAVVSRPHYDKILHYIDIAREEGGIILCGGQAVHPEGVPLDGLYIQPTIIEGLPNSCRTNQEEIFGPVVTLQKFSTVAEAIHLANDSSYGLAANVWTQDLQKTMKLARELDFGIVWFNTWLNRDLRTPFGGMKNSGVGREGGFDALRFFTESKNVCISW